MTSASNEMKQQRAAQLRSSRAADERLIEAIFGDVLFGRLPRNDHGADVLAAHDPVIAADIPVTVKGF